MARTETEGNDRLAERDDHDQGVALGEVPGRQMPALAAADVRAEHVDHERKYPHGQLRGPVQRGGDEEESDAHHAADREPRDRTHQVTVASARDRVQDQVCNPNHAVGAREEERVVAEDVRDRQRRDQHRRHGPEHHDPDEALFRIDRVRQPGVRGPRPPEHTQHDQSLGEPCPGRVGDHEAGHLRDREHEDQVEEELERRDALLGALLFAGLDRHRPSLSLGIRTLRAAAWAAALSGIPSTVHALATGRDPLEAVLAAGSVLLPHETSRARLVAAAVPVHLALALTWTVALDRAGVRTARRGALAGLAIAALDLGVIDGRFPRVRALPLGPQLADHAAFGAIAGRLLARD